MDFSEHVDGAVLMFFSSDQRVVYSGSILCGGTRNCIQCVDVFVFCTYFNFIVLLKPSACRGLQINVLYIII